tara:strand:- start:42 stop:230 length:189 start_codon:yes stop_codon:yes gene_type:complete
MIGKMNITSAKYLKDGISDENSSIKATIEGQELFVPLAEGNMHYDEIMRQVEAGELTIEEAD